MGAERREFVAEISDRPDARLDVRRAFHRLAVIFLSQLRRRVYLGRHVEKLTGKLLDGNGTPEKPEKN